MDYLTIAFDFDGVLADTLPQHFEFCQAEARKFKIVLPQKSQREIVDNPMEKLLEKAGFPDDIIPLVIADYERESFQIIKFLYVRNAVKTAPFRVLHF